jgi:hypothetical protein
VWLHSGRFGKNYLNRLQNISKVVNKLAKIYLFSEHISSFPKGGFMNFNVQSLETPLPEIIGRLPDVPKAVVDHDRLLMVNVRFVEQELRALGHAQADKLVA